MQVGREYNIIYKKYYGIIDLKDLLVGAKETLQITEKMNLSKLLLDFTNTSTHISPLDIKRLSQHLTLQEDFLPLHIAIVVNTPFHTAASLLFKEFMRKENSVEIYSTPSNAFNWLTATL